MSGKNIENTDKINSSCFDEELLLDYDSLKIDFNRFALEDLAKKIKNRNSLFEFKNTKIANYGY